VVHKIEFRQAAIDDLKNLYLIIAEAAGHDRAFAYVGRLEIACRKLATFPARGTIRDHINPGLRIIGFERSASIAFAVRDNVVDILRVLPRGMELPEQWDIE
jgi:toxin ParE1/3/4